MVGIVGPDHLVVFTIHNFDKRLHSCAGILGDRMHDNTKELFDDRSLDFPLQDILKVLDVPLLAGLSDTSASPEPLPPIIRDGFNEIVSKP